VKGRLVRWLIAMFAIQLVFGAGQALAATLVVDDNYPVPQSDCPNATSNSIQLAVLTAAPGDTVLVCPGTYQEQVRVPAKTNVTIRSKVPLAAIIKAPPVMTPLIDGSSSIVEITAASANVSLLQFVITGPGAAVGCGSGLTYGVYVNGGSSANIVGNHITAIRHPYETYTDPATNVVTTELSGCQSGVAVRVGRNASAQVGRANILNNLIDDYQKGGVVIDGPGSYGLVRGNQIIGFGPSKTIAQNGIQVSRKAVATVDQNIVRRNQYAPSIALGPDAALVSSEGILLYGASTPGSVISNNRVTNNDDNIAGTVDLAQPNGDFPTATPTAFVRIVNNVALNAVKYDGIYMELDTFHNWIEGNFARYNKMYDCEDQSHGDGTSGTANFWIHNDGVTQYPPGICNAGRGGGHHEHHHDDPDD
jgi:hypothetical protein